MADEREDQRRQEALKLYYDYFKQLTTLSVATAVVVLAIYGEGIAGKLGLSIAMLLFGLAVYIASIGMIQVLKQFTFQTQLGEPPARLLNLVQTLFVTGLLMFMYIAFGLPVWALPSIALILSIAILGVYWLSQ